jgi:eukaryotic-like serine/threonine-protein kinase
MGERLFVSDHDRTRALYQIRADGSAPAKVMLRNPRAVEEVQWSRDGKWLIYRIGSGGRRDIYARAAFGDSVQRPVVNGDAEEFSPSLSPDGRWLAYGSDESGRFEVYVRPFPNTGAARWQVSREGRIEPLWSGTGRELY